MRLPTEEITWIGHGWLAERAAAETWPLLVGALLAGAAIVVVSYRFTLVRLSPARRMALAALRLAMWAALLAVLAGPTRIRRSYDHPTKTTRPLAVLVDRSESMTVPDNRQQRRVDDALVQWRRVEPAATKSFSTLSSFAFARDVVTTVSPADTPRIATDRTDLFASIRHVLANPPAGGWGGAIVLTDGVDTSAADVATARRETVKASLEAGTPLYFIVGRNRVLEGEFFRLREFNVPPRTPPRSMVRLNAIFESAQNNATTIPAELLDNGRLRPAGSVRIDAGRHLETWTAEGRAESPGVITIELRAGREVARAEVRVEEPPTNRILLQQGRLDWSHRFLAQALRHNETFTVTSVWDQSPAGLALPPQAVAEFPADAELGSYGFIVLENVSPAQLPVARQTTFARWVNEGGILVFVAPDTLATAGFAGSELEKTLPAEMPSGIGDPAVAVARPGLVRPVVPELTPFSWENSARMREIFGDAPMTPAFASYAHLGRLKPGAEPLARHPQARGPDGKGEVLLAVQRYGRGKSVLLATDALWRWQLEQPHASHAAEGFWTTLLDWLNRDREAGFYFDHPPVHAPVGKDLVVRIAGAKAKSLPVEATRNGQKLPLVEVPSEDGNRAFRWLPPAAGFWQIDY